ncbi:MAG: GldM family protein [Flavobacteriales bacterium]
MMYLVLTALLALNVSKEILDAFILMDTGLRKTEMTLTSKNNETMGAFASKMGANPEKTAPFNTAAQEVVQRSDELLEYLEQMKARTMTVSHKANSLKFGEGYEEFMDEDGKAVALDALNAEGDPFVTVKDENQENTSLLVGSNPQAPHDKEWSAYEMKTKLIAFGDFLKNIQFKEVTGKTWKVPEPLKASLEQTFTYEDVQDGELVSKWETKNFYHNPLAAIIPLMTKLQVDVQNAEADMLSTLLGGIEGKSYKFTNLVPLVVPQSNYILQGDTFRAEVLLAAYDGTNPPKIYVDQNPWDRQDSSMIENVTDEMKLSFNERGLGSLKIPANKVGLGEHAFKGKIIYKGPSGEESYALYVPPVTVSSPALVVSPTKMNVFYRGLPNPVEISVPGVPADKIRPSISSGHTLTKTSEGWVVKPGNGKEATISVTAEMPDGSTQSMGKKEFRVKRIPDPVPKFAGKYPTDNTVPKGDLSVAAGIRAEMVNFDFEVDVRVTSFNMIFIRDGNVVEKSSSSYKVTDEMKANIKKVGKGQKVYLEKIKVKMPDGTTRQVANISLKVV